MRRILPVLCLLTLTAPVMAAEHGAPAGEKSAEGGAPGTNIDMPFLMAPMNGADGKLTSYAYITCRLTANSNASASDVREKIAFIQDAFVRDVNGAPIVTAEDPTKINMPGLQARLLADARKVMGGNKVVSLAIVQIQIAPLHPRQVPSAPRPPDSTPPPPAAPPAAHGGHH